MYTSQSSVYGFFLGNCSRNITCNCETDKEEEIKPEKQAAIFAKEFQDNLWRTIFTKENDEKESPANSSSNLSTITPTNCSNDAQVGFQKTEKPVSWSVLFH